MGTKLEAECKGGVRVKKEYEACSRCLELQDQINKDNRTVIELLEGKIGFMELIKLEMEDEMRILKQKNEELEQSIRNGNMEEEEKMTQLMIENNVLECEKKRAENEVEIWKAKCKELEMQVLELKKRLSLGFMKTGVGLLELDSQEMNKTDRSMHGFNGIDKPIESIADEDEYASGTPPNVIVPVVKGGGLLKSKSRVKKSLDFTNVVSPRKNFSPATPAGRPFDPIDLSDSDDDKCTVDLKLPDIDSEGRGNARSSTYVGVGKTADEKKLNSKDALESRSDEEDVTHFNGRTPHLSVRKRRRRGREVTSESESDSDDKKPRVEHKSDMKLHSTLSSDSSSEGNLKEPTRRRRLTRLSCNEEKGISGKSSQERAGIGENLETPRTVNETDDEDEIEEDEFETESLDGFIVHTSEEEDHDSISNSDGISEHDSTPSHDGGSGNTSDCSVSLQEILYDLRKSRKDKTKWDLEGDMLADLGEDPELCMRAVCALYRQQTPEEKFSKATMKYNRRGFNQCDARGGSKLAEFLTDGNSDNDLMKLVKQLQEYDSKGVEDCRKLATHYSKQLFQIYKNGEDKYFKPSQAGS